MPVEVMASLSSSDALRPTVNQPPRRSYFPVRTRQVKLIPTAEALKLLSGTRVGHYRKVIRKVTVAEAQTWDPTAICTSNAEDEQSGTVVSSANVTSHSVGANHTGSGDTHLQTLNHNILRNLCGAPVEPDQKNVGVPVSKTKGLEKFNFEICGFCYCLFPCRLSYRLSKLVQIKEKQWLIRGKERESWLLKMVRAVANEDVEWPRATTTSVEPA